MLSLTDELILARGSTYGYLAHGLAGVPATVYGISHVNIERKQAIAHCGRVPTNEACFHQLGNAIHSSAHCQAGHRNATARHSVLYQLSETSH